MSTSCSQLMQEKNSVVLGCGCVCGECVHWEWGEGNMEQCNNAMKSGEWGEGDMGVL